MDKDLDFLLDEYFEKFGDYFPTENYACSIEEIKIEIKNCITSGRAAIVRNDVKY